MATARPHAAAVTRFSSVAGRAGSRGRATIAATHAMQAMIGTRISSSECGTEPIALAESDGNWSPTKINALYAATAHAKRLGRASASNGNAANAYHGITQGLVTRNTASAAAIAIAGVR